MVIENPVDSGIDGARDASAASNVLHQFVIIITKFIRMMRYSPLLSPIKVAQMPTELRVPHYCQNTRLVPGEMEFQKGDYRAHGDSCENDHRRQQQRETGVDTSVKGIDSRVECADILARIRLSGAHYT